MRARWMGAILGVAVIMAMASAGSGADRDAGKKVYVQKCQGCHGADGKGNPAMAKAFKNKLPDLGGIDLAKLSKAEREQREKEFRNIIAEGKLPMPPFGKSLSMEDQENVLAYIEKAFMNGGK